MSNSFKTPSSSLCRFCHEEPAIYAGLCEICISGDEKDPTSGKFNLRHAPKRKRTNRDKEED